MLKDQIPKKSKEAARAFIRRIVEEINRLLETEKPGVVYIPKLPGMVKAGVNRKVNAGLNMWQRGYVKKRLERKCRERSVELAEVFGKGISTECCRCGAEGRKEGDIFRCNSCGQEMPERQNTAVNVLNRGKKLKAGNAGET